MREFIKKAIDYTLGLLLFWGLASIIAVSIGYILNMGANAIIFVIGLAVGLVVTHLLYNYILEKIPRVGIIMVVAVEWFGIYLLLQHFSE